MDVVFHAADEEGRAIELFGDAAEVRMKRVANRMPQRGIGLQPKVARASQPWALGRNPVGIPVVRLRFRNKHDAEAEIAVIVRLEEARGRPAGRIWVVVTAAAHDFETERI